MESDSAADLEQRYLVKAYAKRPVTIVRGEGCRLYDYAGKEYIDCAGGYGTCIVGHSHPEVVAAIKSQAAKLTACHASVYNDARADLLLNLAKITPTPLKRFFLSNSGAEAVEAAIKIARKHTKRENILAFTGAYHGKTFGALSATWDKKYRTSFEPLLPNFIHTSYGDLEQASKAIDDKTAAVIVEPIQGESGVRLPPPGFLKGLKIKCEETGSLLIADEVQTGFGRTGTIFACEHPQVVPDILAFGKGVASGLPIGVTAARDEIAESMAVGEHTTTYGGNPLVSAAASATIKVLLKENLPSKAGSNGQLFKQNLENLRKKYRVVRDVRGMGLMLALESRFDVYGLLTKLLSNQIIALDAGRNVIRFLPPLVISPAEIGLVTQSLDKVLEDEEAARLQAATAH